MHDHELFPGRGVVLFVLVPRSGIQEIGCPVNDFERDPSNYQGQLGDGHPLGLVPEDLLDLLCQFAIRRHLLESSEPAMKKNSDRFLWASVMHQVENSPLITLITGKRWYTSRIE